MANPFFDPITKFQAPTTGKFMAHVGVVFCLAYLVGWIDRSNIGFAKLQMVKDLQLTEAGFALAASMFFIGYVLVDVPIAFALSKVKPARMLAGMLTGFGVVTALLALTDNAKTLAVLRFLLGVAEGGLAPAIFLYVAAWTPYTDRLRVSGMILAVALTANVFGSVLCGALLDLDGLGGLRGWQWLFLLTALPSIGLGVAILWLLPDGPQQARFYTPEEKAGLARALAAEHADIRYDANATLLELLRNPLVWVMFGVGATAGTCTYGLAYWLPTVIRQFGVSNTVNGVLSALPWLVGILAMLWLPSRAERSASASLWILSILMASAIAFALLPMSSSAVLSYVLICVGAIGCLGLQPFVLILPTRFLRGQALAYAYPLGAMATNFTAFASQNAIARVGQAFGPASGLLLVAGATAMLALLMSWLYQASVRPVSAAAASPA